MSIYFIIAHFIFIFKYIYHFFAHIYIYPPNQADGNLVLYRSTVS